MDSFLVGVTKKIYIVNNISIPRTIILVETQSNLLVLVKDLVATAKQSSTTKKEGYHGKNG